VRAYRSDPIPAETVRRVLDAARIAPTAVNRQPFRIVVLTTADKRAALKRVYHRDWFSQGPLVICLCGIKSEAWVRRDGRSYLDIDVAIAMDHLILAATDEGLGTCWVANFDAPAARDLMRLPDGVEPIVMTPLGYPAETPSAKKRLPLDDLVRYETY
jgi:nitroreductase